jgi:hypothetical protein
MGPEADEEELKRLCELATREQNGEKLIALTTKIITLLDAKHAKLSAATPEK